MSPRILWSPSFPGEPVGVSHRSYFAYASGSDVIHSSPGLLPVRHRLLADEKSEDEHEDQEQDDHEKRYDQHPQR